jgi:hypothetical protein
MLFVATTKAIAVMIEAEAALCLIVTMIGHITASTVDSLHDLY